MFQSSDDFNIDEDFLNDAFEPQETVRNTDDFNFQPVKKFCSEKPRQNDIFAVPSTSKSTVNIFARKPPKGEKIKEGARKIVSRLFDDASMSNDVKKCHANPLDMSSEEWTENIVRIFSKKPENDVNKRNIEEENRTLVDIEQGIIKRNPGKKLVLQRKFPGPAGLLPESRISIDINALEEYDVLINNKTVMPEEIICSQPSDNCFKEGPWLEMCKDYYIENTKLYLPEKYSISWVKLKSMSKQLIRQKTPFLAAVIKSMDATIKNPTVVLKDPTGEMDGTFHYEVWDQFSDQLHVGAVIVLRQVGVLSMSKKRYLNITLNNIVTIYSYKNNESYILNEANTKLSQKNFEMNVTRVKKLTCEDIIRDIEENKRCRQEETIDDSLESDNPFFRTNVSNISFESDRSGTNRGGNGFVRAPIGSVNRNVLQNVISSSVDEKNLINTSRFNPNINRSTFTNNNNKFNKRDTNTILYGQENASTVSNKSKNASTDNIFTSASIFQAPVPRLPLSDSHTRNYQQQMPQNSSKSNKFNFNPSEKGCITNVTPDVISNSCKSENIFNKFTMLNSARPSDSMIKAPVNAGSSERSNSIFSLENKQETTLTVFAKNIPAKNTTEHKHEKKSNLNLNVDNTDDFDITFNVDTSPEILFRTSTQKESSVKQQNCEENFLEGIEDSFLEEF